MGKKRSAEGQEQHVKFKTAQEKSQALQTDDFVFEDPYEDELDEDDQRLEAIHEEVVSRHAMEDGVQEEDEEEDDEQVVVEDTMEEAENSGLRKEVWRAGIDPMAEDEQLEYDSTAYDLFHRTTVEWPCLSFDVVADSLGAQRTKYPMTSYIVAGSQADRMENNQLYVMKWSQLHKTKHDDDEDDENLSDSEDEDLDDDPILEHKCIPHPGAVNRVRSMPQQSNIIATWADTGIVHLWNIEKQLRHLNAPPHRDEVINTPTVPFFSFQGHPTEGFAMDWSPIKPGRFASGDCRQYIYLWDVHEGGEWVVDKVPYTGHADSVEDIAFSPTQANVFASSSVDRTLKIWDANTKGGPKLSIQAHDSDVNVISWNKNVAYLVASGSDDGSIKVWDLRNFNADMPLAHFKWHKGPITSVNWHPTEDIVLAVSSADNQVTIWDLSLERDEDDDPEMQDVPPQLLFVHQGQDNVKEIKFHPQLPGVLISTAADGFNIFKPAGIYVDPNQAA